jgi:CubicO group peptidase (beta-lactamase class C family)/D-alanyl-D-alanine dipeptidase
MPRVGLASQAKSLFSRPVSSSLAGLLLALIAPRAEAQSIVHPRPDVAALVRGLEQRIEARRVQHRIRGLSVALVRDNEIVWARGFGSSDAAGNSPADARSLYRVGSVSKLINALIAQRLAEQGVLDLDAPIREIVPEFQPSGGDGVTARHLLSHRSGLVREPPRGSYFDAAPPAGLAEVVASLGRTPLVDLPGARTKYSNLGPSVVGLAIERKTGRPFADVARDLVFAPLGMADSDFTLPPAFRDRLVQAEMWTLDGRRFEAPVFQLGTGPAGNLVSSVLDLARLTAWMMDPAPPAERQIVSPATLKKMWVPQFAPADPPSGFGVGFALQRFAGTLRVGHGGAVYGYSTELAALPEYRLGVVVCAALDGAWADTRLIADESLTLLLAARKGETVPPIEDTTGAIGADRARALAGSYGEPPNAFDLWDQGDRLLLWAHAGGLPSELRARGERLFVDGPLARGLSIGAAENALTIGSQSYAKRPDTSPGPCPERWQGLVGEYGPDHNILYICEHQGRLCALIEWFFLYALEEVAPGRFRFEGDGLYVNEEIIFECDQSGRATTAVAAGVPFSRRLTELQSDRPFRIQPKKPIDRLRGEIEAAKPPAEAGEFLKPDLVDLATLDPTIQFEIRYATDQNFLGTSIYSSARAFLQRPAAEALLRAHQQLSRRGYGLLIHDAYRPWKITKLFWDATDEADHGFVADPAKGSRHNRGCAVDLTLYDLKTGRAVDMPSGYDEFTDRARPFYFGGTSVERFHRDLLRHALEAEGFTVFDGEWWHFDFGGWDRYPILDIPFEEVTAGR